MVLCLAIALPSCGGGGGGGSSTSASTAAVPGAPSGVTATAGNASAQVSWTAPAANGNPISTYTVTPYSGGAVDGTPVVVGSATPTATVAGLTNGVSYTFTVLATSALGNGPESTPSPAVTPRTVPGAPAILAAVAGNAAATISWTVPPNGGSAILGYKVTASSGAIVTVGPGVTSASVPGLIDGSVYTFTVYAYNAAGNGPPSAASAQVTPSVNAINVAVTPRRVALTTSQTQQFTATVTGSGAVNQTVAWNVDGVAGGNATVGTVDGSGLYAPPNTGGTHVITAISQIDGTTSASSAIAVTDLAGVFTYHNDAARTGQNLQEYALTQAIVSSTTTFGKLFSCAVDASVYAQPLYVANLAIGGGTHNVVFVVTEKDSVYAFDADGAVDPVNGGCLAYWYRSFLSTGVTAVPSGDTQGALDLPGTMGITGTPVIGNSTIYMVARMKTGTSTYTEQLRALNIATGADIANSPVTIAASVPGTAQGTTTVTFNSLQESQRPALLLFGTSVYLAFGSAGDGDPFSGWLLAYDSGTLAQTGVFNSTPNGGLYSRGAFWMAGGGPAADASNIYIATANGVFDDTANVVPPVAPANDMGDSLLKFNGTLALQDYFTPASQAAMASGDLDFGSGGVTILPDSMGSAAHPHLAVAVGKPGNFYLVDRASMSRYKTGAGSTDGNVQTINAGGEMFSTPTVWGSTLYVAAAHLQAFPVSNGVIGASSTQTADYLATTASISATGASNGIIWILNTAANGASGSSTWGPAILKAYDATNLAVRLYTSDAVAADACGNAVKFTVPTVANGHVYVGGAAGTAAGQAGVLTVYGLKP
jgi:hypothetical protein